MPFSSTKERLRVFGCALANRVREIARTIDLHENLQGFPYWVAAVAVGFIAVLYSTGFSWAIRLAQAFAMEHRYFFLAFSPICFALACWLVQKYAPVAGGTGVPSVISVLQLDPIAGKERIEATLSPRVALITIASSLLCVLGGGALGREGPMVLIAACVFCYVGKKFTRIWPFGEHRSWVVAGGAAGVAAAFQTPLAGVIFVVEELTQQHFHAFKTYVISAVVIAGMIAQWLFGRYLYLGHVRFNVVPYSSVFWAMVLGLLCGIGAGLFEWIVVVFRRHTVRLFGEKKIFLAAVLGLAVAAIAVYLDNRVVGGGISFIEELLFQNGQATWTVFFARFFGTALSHLSGCAGGFLAPSLSLGAALGSKFAVLIDYPSHKLMVMVGMVGFLGAITRAPFTALVVVMEMTESHTAIFPLMIASVVSYGTVRLIAGRLAK